MRLDQQTEQLVEQNKQFSNQNKQIELQNELASVSLVASLRQTLLAEPNHSHELPNVKIAELAESCGIRLNGKIRLSPKPNASVVDAIRKLAVRPNSGERIISAIQSLLRDENGTVVMGALEVLSKLGKTPEIKNISVNNVFAYGLDLNFDESVDINFRQSYLSKFRCTGCKVNYYNVLSSIITGVKSLSSNESIHIGMTPHEKSDNITMSQSMIINIKSGNIDKADINNLDNTVSYDRITPYVLSGANYERRTKKVYYYYSEVFAGEADRFGDGQITPVNSCEEISDLCQGNSPRALWTCEKDK